MKTLTLFAGAGGADIGMSNAGAEHVRCIEWVKAAADTLKAAGFPGVHGDVRDLTLYRDLPPIDLLWASPPCQDWSSAGKRQGASGERNGWPWTWLVVDHLRRRGLGPRWFIAENVPGMLTHSGEDCGKGCCADPARCPRTYFLEVVLKDARERFGWADWREINAAGLGVPQFRRRVFLVAGPRPIRWPEMTHADPASLAQASMFGPRLKPWVTVRDALGLDVHALATAHGPGLSADERRISDLSSRPALTVPASPMSPTAGGVMFTFIRTEATGAVATPDTMPAPTVGNQYLHRSDPGVRAASEPGRVDRPAPTVSCSEEKGSGENANPQKMQRASDALFLATGRRRLTPEECAILQDLPAGYPFQGTKSAVYKQVGNAVPPKMAEVLMQAVMEADDA